MTSPSATPSTEAAQSPSIGDSRSNDTSPVRGTRSWDVWLSALSAVIIGAVPLAYTMYPSLSANPGLWRNNRLVVAVVWAVVVGCIVAVAASRQDRLQEKRHATVKRVDGSVARAEAAVATIGASVTTVETSLAEAKSVLSQATDTLAAMAFNAGMAELGRELAAAMARTLAESKRAYGDPGLPATSHFLLHAVGPVWQEERRLWPVYPSQTLIDPCQNGHESERLRGEAAVQSFLGIQRAAAAAGDAAVVDLTEAGRRSLPTAFRRVSAAAAFPVRNHVYELVGVVTVCASAELRGLMMAEPPLFSRAMLDAADDVSGLLAEASTMLMNRGGKCD